MTPREKAEKARELLDDPIVKAAFSDVRDWLVKSMESTALDDVTSHHEFAISLQLLKRLQGQIAAYANDLLVDEHKLANTSFMDQIREGFNPRSRA